MFDLYQGDCLEIMKQIPDGSIDLVLADIPYGCVNRKSAGLRNFDKGKADIETFSIDDVSKEIIRVCKGSVYIFGSIQQLASLQTKFVSEKMSTRVCVWEKTNPTPVNGQHLWLSGIEYCIFGRKKKAVFNERCKNTVFRYPSGKSKLHPTQKPVALMERFINASTNKDETVLDFTMGSGTTGVACANTGRKFIGIELDEHYFNIAKQRIEEAHKAAA